MGERRKAQLAGLCATCRYFSEHRAGGEHGTCTRYPKHVAIGYADEYGCGEWRRRLHGHGIAYEPGGQAVEL